ncbi:pseudouridine 5'-phosphatase [Aureococcus anophagefferens]|nr:pseudouridine 5'-phosphatase [Aureococcus anophagefferens]
MVASVAALQPPKALQAILFDIDGTLFDSDPVHLRAFQKILVEEGFNGGVEIDEAFFMKTISGRQNKLICRDIFPEWDEARFEAFSARKEQMFRDMSRGSLAPIDGLIDFMGEIDRCGLRKAATPEALTAAGCAALVRDYRELGALLALEPAGQAS